MKTIVHVVLQGILLVGVAGCSFAALATQVDAARIHEASGAEAKPQPDGSVRIGWSRTDVPVVVDGMTLAPAAGLGSWAAFAPMGDKAMVMGDTVVFQDEVDAAIDAAFAHGLSVTGLHNHFFFDQPRVFFMHIGGEGSATQLAEGVKAVWDAIKAVRADHAQPAQGFGGPVPKPGTLDSAGISKIVGHPAPLSDGVAKITVGREGKMRGHSIGAPMGLTTWAAFSGGDALAAMDGDFIMTANEVRPVLMALRKAGVHVVALHNHMMGGQPAFFFAHFWGKGNAAELAQGFRNALDAQAAVKAP